MAAFHAGAKRSYNQMHDSGLDRSSRSVTTSREPSPLRRRSVDPKETPGLRSGYNTPNVDWTAIPRQASFSDDASLVLIGVRGVGKSSLGVLAAAAYGRRLIDSERAFLEATSITTQAYRKLHGATEYQKKHYQVFQQTLQAHDKGCVIVCSFSDLENHGSVLLRDFAQRHPVVHIIREAQGIQLYLQVWSLERTRQLLRASGPLLRSCTNYEFFNTSEALVEKSHEGVQDLAKASNGLYLTLKRVERDFLKFLNNIIGTPPRMPSQHSPYPLSQVPLSQRLFTMSTVVEVDDIVDGKVNVEALMIGVDAVEIKVPLSEPPTNGMYSEDQLLRVSQALAIVRRPSIVPAVLSVILSIDSTGHEGAQKSLLTLLTHCYRLAPEFCTVDSSLSDAQLALMVASKGRTQLIALTQMQERLPDGWSDEECLAAYERADRLGFDVVKITMPATSVSDNFAVHSFRQRVERLNGKARLIAYNTGKGGRPSMCFNKLLTPVRYAYDPPKEPGDSEDVLLTAKDVFTSLFASFIYEPMRFFIYGANVSFSLSPAMHNAAYAACGMSHTFGTHSSPNLDDFKRLSQDHHFGGAAVVQPYKTGVMPLLDGLSSHARAIGSVNTIIPVRRLQPDGSIPDELELLSQCNKSGPVKALYGDNTDWIGIRACLRHGSSPANTVRPQTTALICGAGGQARSTIYSMLSLGVRNIFICNRTSKNAQILADHYNKLIESHAISELDPADSASTRVRVIESFERAWPRNFRQPSMIVSSIPTQTADGKMVDFKIPDDWLKSPTGGVVLELAYKPLITPIVQQMRERSHQGWIFMDGFDVLPEQAFVQFELFTGRRAPRRLMRMEVIKRYREEQSQ
ncbi:quinate utilization gene repressor [Teratosphaeria nubilosa]|uniref:Quinate utilization gene repressor n=1 Tax=Teratosphaeria nubilosa TaxID=161662 RepID=A0A6G1LE68_9PEZI|nr:quinate utilization gene repressor [Teratosphaeria nubilosa]